MPKFTATAFQIVASSTEAGIVASKQGALSQRYPEMERRIDAENTEVATGVNIRVALMVRKRATASLECVSNMAVADDASI